MLPRNFQFFSSTCRETIWNPLPKTTKMPLPLSNNQSRNHLRGDRMWNNEEEASHRAPPLIISTIGWFFSCLTSCALSLSSFSFIITFIAGTICDRAPPFRIYTAKHLKTLLVVVRLLIAAISFACIRFYWDCPRQLNYYFYNSTFFCCSMLQRSLICRLKHKHRHSHKPPDKVFVCSTFCCFLTISFSVCHMIP